MKSKFIYAITLLLGLSLFPFYAKAQNWQAYKGVWLKGYDNAAQAPLPPSGYSALTYFADSLGTYVYDWDSLAWLRIPGTGGGGGSAGLTTASNGLNVNPAGNVKLGGTLTENTNILGAGNILNITNSSGSDNGLFEVRPTQIRSQVSSPSSQLTETMQDDAYSLVMTDNQTYSNTFSISPTTMRFLRSGSSFTYAGEITLGSSGITLAHGLANGRGLTFNGTTTNRVYRMSSDLNNSIDFNFANSGQSRITTTDRLIINGGTVEMPAITENTNLTDSVMMLDGNGRIFWKTISGGGGGFTTADNGLTASSATNVQLGGTLIQNTTIPLAGFSYTVGQFPDNVNFSVDDASNTITANLSAGTNGALLSMTASNAVFQHSGASGTATLTLDQSTETATINSSSGSALDIDVSSTGGVDVNSSGSLDLATPTVRVELQSGVDRVVMRNPGISTSFIRFDILNNDPEIMLAGSTQSQVSAIAGNTFVVKSRNNASGANNSGDLHLHTGDVLSGKAGDILIQTGAVSSGTNGNITLNARAGFIIINPASLPTTDPCGSAPSGTVWSDSGTLKVCP